ncbi:protein NARROW LEAF 1 isoform X1 [Triticum aestivum]|uniref:protein NARROW LEAF 1 isoform X1 n=1 Tax=Triticum aestivum TaxID=4565 RepID=UPI001D00C26B|nr:protein NARROW LEAF 1-like isoform X1 [Triticum aestivum]XP_044325742.1 protein NARROW LEAF 1-like isoform X1 [Triticum aestivum]
MKPSDDRMQLSGLTQSEESSLDVEGHCSHHEAFPCSPSMQPVASGCVHTENSAAYFLWPTSNLQHCAAEGRANYFGNLQKGLLPILPGKLPKGQQANSLLDLMTIRAFHSKILKRFSLGTAVGFRITKGVLTETPAILVFVARKVHKKWLNPNQCLPAILAGPGGVWCDVDVVEFSYYGAPAQTPKEQMFSELVNKLCGSDEYIGSGSQVASQDTFGTLGAIVKRRTNNKQVGFLTNRHVAVDLNYPNQKMFHPLPPNLGPGVYLGAVERATSFITDDVWYGIYAGTNPDMLPLCGSAETFVRADGAFIPFADDFDISTVTTIVREVGEIGDVKIIDLQCPIKSLIGRQVCKVGRSSGHTTGTVMAYALEYNDEKGICFFTDLLVVGENRQTFDLEGDSGSLIILTSQDGEKPRPIGIIWGGTANRGRIKLTSEYGPENWTTGVDLGRLLDRLELDLIINDESLKDAVQEQRKAFVAAITSAIGESSAVTVTAPEATPAEKAEEIFEPLGIQIQQLPRHDLTNATTEGEGATNTPSDMEERQFISNFVGMSPVRHDHDARRSIANLNNPSEEELAMSLHLGDREPKRLRLDPESSLDLEKQPHPDPEPSLDLEERPRPDPEMMSLDLEKQPRLDPEPGLDLEKQPCSDPEPGLDLEKRLPADPEPSMDLEK